MNHLKETHCENCGISYMSEPPQYCCNGRDCGCYGMPINGPFVCSEECYHFLKLKVHCGYYNRFNGYYHDKNVRNIYPLGSRVYGSFNERSDYDYILVADEMFDSKNVNVHVYTKEAFQLALDNHDIQVLECVHLLDQYKIKEEVKFTYTLDKFKLRPSISTIANNSYVKAKKKLIISGDYDLNLALKSFYHSYRILDFGIQIASEGKISDYSSCNWLLDDLKKMSTEAERDQLWTNIETKYKEKWNKHSSKFKSLCPKDDSKKRYINQLNDLFKNHKLEPRDHKDLIEDIYNLMK